MYACNKSTIKYNLFKDKLMIKNINIFISWTLLKGNNTYYNYFEQFKLKSYLLRHKKV